ncbi:MAG: hypothetical protein QOE55_763, partial [Acidobacteriaceae bacterium]|nr:hypothetical protein [Acidobacteriaceae bacterium]
AATTGNFPKLIERLSLVRALDIEPERATRVHQNYWLKLAREGAQSTVQHLAEFEPLRRYATLTALVLELTATLTDEALNMFEHLVGQLFKKAERAHAEQFHSSGKSINEKVRLYARIGQALIEARSSGSDAFAAIEAVVPWLKFESTVAEAQTLAQPEEFDYLALLDERYGSVRRFAPLLLAHFEFHAAPSAAELLLALNLLRDLNASGKRTLPSLFTPDSQLVRQIISSEVCQIMGEATLYRPGNRTPHLMRESNLRLSVLFSEIYASRLCHTAGPLYAGYES